MRCEDVRARLSAYAAGELEEPAKLEVHLASCGACALELDRYRQLGASLATLATRLEDPSSGFRDRLIEVIPPKRVRDDVLRIAREHPQVVPLGTAAIGAAAIGLLWWRATRRKAVPETEPATALPAESSSR
jgi:anti-sigma factor RsiW